MRTLLYVRSQLWERIRTLFEAHPERLKVARTILENGLAVRGDRVYLNQIEIPTLRIATTAGVDRRTVAETLRVLNKDSELKAIFSSLESAGLSLRKVAKQLGLGVVEITAEDPNKAGILAAASRLLAEAGISIRQALVGDPELEPEPKLVLIGQKKVPGSIIPEMLNIEGVAKVSVY